MSKSPMSDIVVVLPGITGSVLQRNGVDVWAISAQGAWQAIKTMEGSIQSLRLHEDPPDVDDLGDGVTADRLVSDVHLIPGLWKIDGYTKLMEEVERQFQVARGENFFEFPYDWRRDNRVAARRLDRFVREKLRAWRDRSGSKDAKVIFVAHSMGGLVARYFIECLEGWRDTRMLFTFGTPFRGSLNALDFIAHGMRKAIGRVTLTDLSDLLRSFTSVYQLLPIYACCKGGDGALHRVTEIDNLPNLDPLRAARALDFHREIREAVKRHERDEAYQRDPYALHPVVGILQPTLQSARLEGKNLVLLRELEGSDMGGDGTVPRISATPVDVKQEEGAVFAAERHASLQNFEPAMTHLRGILTGLTIDTSKYFAPQTALSLDLEDAFFDDEPVSVAALPRQEPVELTVEISSVASGQVVAGQDLARQPDGWHRAELRPLPAGLYRVRVDAPFGAQAVTDLLASIDRGIA